MQKYIKNKKESELKNLMHEYVEKGNMKLKYHQK